MTLPGPVRLRPRSSGSKPYVPHDYQKRAIRKMLEQACLGLFLHPGLGKTSISLMTHTILQNKKFIKATLVIAPLRAIYNVWPAEVKKWQEMSHLSVGIIHGADKLAVLREKHDIYVINPEAVAWLVDVLLKMKVWPFDMLVVDESTKFKDGRTQRFLALRKILPKFKRRYILTGTPVPNGLLDLFGQIYILDLGHSLGAYITRYRATYFYQTGYGGYTWAPQFDAMERITERIEPLTLTMTREEYLTLPELVQTMVWLDLPKPARKIYKDMETKFLTELANGEVITSPNAAAAGGKCRQILNGALYTSPDKDWEAIHDAKLDALADLLEELSGAPLLVLYEFIHDKERLLKRFPFAKIIGGQSMKKDQLVIEQFNRGEIGMVIGHPASMGHALNLQGQCAHVCWFGLTWNFEHYDQAIQRVWRQGNEATHVIVYHLCVRNSLDEVVVKAIYGKDMMQESFTRQVQSLANRAG